MNWIRVTVALFAIFILAFSFVGVDKDPCSAGLHKYHVVLMYDDPNDLDGDGDYWEYDSLTRCTELHLDTKIDLGEFMLHERTSHHASVIVLLSYKEIY